MIKVGGREQRVCPVTHLQRLRGQERMGAQRMAG